MVTYDMGGVQGTRVYFEAGWFGRGSRVIRDGHRQFASIDGSFLPFLIEELLALSASKVVVPKRSQASLFSDSIAAPHAEYLQIIDVDPAVQRAYRAFEPVWVEFEVRLASDAVCLPSTRSGEDIDALMTLFDGIRNYLTGVEHRVALGLDLDRLRRATRYLRASADSPEARVLLARLEGFLASYVETRTPTLSWISQGPRGHVRAFRELMEDQEYKQLSAEAHFLGVPTKVARAVQLMARLTRQLLGKAAFAELFSLGTRALQTFSPAPLPSANSVVGLLGTEYVPPIVDLAEIMDRAVLSWLESDAPFIPPPNV